MRRRTRRIPVVSFANAGRRKMKTITAESVEFEGKTVERAVEAACRHFGVVAEELEIEILTKGSTGIFGLGGRKARIKARPKEVAGEARPGVPRKGPEAGEDVEPAAGEPVRQVAVEPGEAVCAGEEEGREELLQVARSICEELLERAGLSAGIEIKAGEDGPYLDIVGEDLSLVIGREGQTLAAIEYIVNRMVARRSEGAKAIAIDAQGYREKRRQSLSSLARKMAQKARKTGRPVALNPMGARERRIVHLCLKNFPGIKTRSVGEGSERKVVISPVGKRYRGKKRSPRR